MHACCFHNDASRIAGCLPKRYMVCSTRTRLPTESFDEDGPRTTPKKKSKLVQRSLLVGAAAFAFVLFNQMMPGGVLSETAVGQAVQAVARKFANALAAVSPCLAFLPL